MVPSGAHKFYLSGKRHARDMKRARGLRTCACRTLIPDVTSEQLNNLRESNQRHKQKRCGQRSYIANVVKLGRWLEPGYSRRMLELENTIPTQVNRPLSAFANNPSACRPPACLLSYTPEPDSEDERASTLAQIKQIYAVFLEAKEAGVDITGAEEPHAGARGGSSSNSSSIGGAAMCATGVCIQTRWRRTYRVARTRESYVWLPLGSI
ncbi:hypothetical protein BD779DRAFT_1785090 [Infundibulicybe gibba]|nr:hypothetical protein BD779DRAFT_1785090 [Infundibulicybe gibba]